MDFKTITTDDDEFIVGYIEGHGLKTVRSDHPNFTLAKYLMDMTPEELEDEGADNIAALFDPAEAISKRFESLTERVSVRNGVVYFDGDPLHNTLTDLIVRLMEEDEDFYAFVLFLENLMQNPNQESVKMAFDWIQRAGDGMSITEDGYVVGFKGTESDGEGGFRSTSAGHAIVNGVDYHGKIPYAVGDEVTMPRSEVTFDPSTSCSSGLHVGTRSYAKQYVRGDGCLMEVLINPRDIVSVPAYEHDKMRVCRFYVNGTVEDDTTYRALHRTSVHVADTENSPYDEDEFGDGEEFVEDNEDVSALLDALDSDEEIEPDYGFGVDMEGEDDDADEPEAFVGRSLRYPTDQEFSDMRDRAKRRHRGSPGSNAFRTYASTVGGWTLRDQNYSGVHPTHWGVA